MLKNQLNKDFSILHWHSIGEDISIIYYIENQTSEDDIYELKLSIANFSIYTPYRENIEKIVHTFIGDDYISIAIDRKNIRKISKRRLTIDQLLNHEDKIMVSTKYFKDNLKIYIRNKKISIINGI